MFSPYDGPGPSNRDPHGGRIQSQHSAPPAHRQGVPFIQLRQILHRRIIALTAQFLGKPERTAEQVWEMRPTSGEIARAHLFHVSRAGGRLADAAHLLNMRGRGLAALGVEGLADTLANASSIEQLSWGSGLGRSAPEPLPRRFRALPSALPTMGRNDNAMF
jgi:hypothetical protein